MKLSRGPATTGLHRRPRERRGRASGVAAGLLWTVAVLATAVVSHAVLDGLVLVDHPHLSIVPAVLGASLAAALFSLNAAVRAMRDRRAHATSAVFDLAKRLGATRPIASAFGVAAAGFATIVAMETLEASLAHGRITDVADAFGANRDVAHFALAAAVSAVVAACITVAGLRLAKWFVTAIATVTSEVCRFALRARITFDPAEIVRRIRTRSRAFVPSPLARTSALRAPPSIRR